MKKPLILVVVLSLLLCCSALAVGDTPGSRDLKLKDIGFDVIAIQNKLIDLGYLGGVAGGVFDEKTANAVDEFGINNGLQVQHGVLDIDTQIAIMNADHSTNENSFEEDDYKDIMRDPVGTWRKAYVIHGVIFQTIEKPVYGFDKTHVTLLVATKDGYDNIIMAEYTRYDGEIRFLEDDVVTIYGEAHGTEEYKTVLNTVKEVPYFLIEKISLDD